MTDMSEFFKVRDTITANSNQEDFFKLVTLLEHWAPKCQVRVAASPMEAARILGPRFKALTAGIGDAYWDRIYEYLLLPEDWSLDEKIKILAYKNTSGVYAKDTTIVVTAKPRYIMFAPNGQIHSETGPAIYWSNGDCLYALNGQHIPKHLGQLLDKGWWTKEDIDYIDKHAIGTIKDFMMEVARRRRLA